MTTRKGLEENLLIRKEEFYPSFPGTYFSTDQWICPNGHWCSAAEKCVHLLQKGVLIDFRKDRLH